MRKAIVFFLFLISAYACSSNTENQFVPYDEGPVVSVINSDTLTSEFFEKAYIEYLINSGRNDTKEQRYTFLRSLTDDILLSQQAKKYQVLDSSYLDYRNQVKRISIADRFYSKIFLDSLSLPTDEQIESAYFNTKVKLQVSHLFFTNQSAANRAYERLENGEKFLDLANEIYHIQPYDSAAGYLGEISYFNVDDAFGEAAYELKSGEYSKPVRTRQGYHIIYVNNRIGNPLMTQAEFEYKKNGIKGLTKDRIKTLKGDAFVRTYMQSLNVQVDKSNVEKLYRSLKEIKPHSNSSSPFGITQDIASYPTSQEIQFVREDLAPKTVLASYEHLGKKKLFSAEDYYNWLKTIPLKEARTRTMASVGRALRNQAFYEAGQEKKLQNAPIVQYNINFKTTLYKAFRVKKYLREQPVGDIPIEEQKAAFVGLGLNTGNSQTFSGWVITADNFEDAQQIKDKITSGQAEPESFSYYESYRNEDIRKIYALQNQVFKTPLNTPVVASVKDAFYVINITDRNMKRIDFEDVQKEVIDRMSKYYNIVHEIKDLRQKATIKVDTTAFEAMMEHFNDPSLKGRR